MRRTPSSLVFPLMAAALVLGGLGGCFNPDFGDGNFSCEEGVCPAGYSCVSEGARQVCRKKGGGLPDSGLDQRVTDLPRVDGAGDGSLHDAPSSDGPRDGQAGDLGQGDAPGDGPRPVDAVVTDAPRLDQLAPDLYPHPGCGSVELVTSELRSQPQSFDLVVDSKGMAHVVLANLSSTLGYTWRSSAASWQAVSTDGLPTTKVDLLAAAISLSTSGEHLHVAYNKTGLSVPGVMHTYRDLQANETPWAVAASVVNQASITGLDLGAAGDNTYIAVSGVGSVLSEPRFVPYRLSYLAGTYDYKPLDAWENDTYGDTRVGVGPTHVAFSVHQETTSITRSWGVSRLTHSASLGTSIAITSAAVSPAAVAVSASGQVHLAFVRRSANQAVGTLHYATWSGLLNAASIETTLISQSAAVASSVDLVLDGLGQPVITFALKGQGLMAYQRVNGAWVLYPLTSSAGANTSTRAVVNQGFLQVAYDEVAGGTTGTQLNYLSCKLP